MSCLQAMKILHEMFHTVRDQGKVCIQSQNMHELDTDPHVSIVVVMVTVYTKDAEKIQKVAHCAASTELQKLYGKPITNTFEGEKHVI